MNTGLTLQCKNSASLPLTVEVINSCRSHRRQDPSSREFRHVATGGHVITDIVSRRSANQKPFGVANGLGVFFLQQLQVLRRGDGILRRILDVFIAVFAAVEEVTHDGPLD